MPFKHLNIGFLFPAIFPELIVLYACLLDCYCTTFSPSYLSSAVKHTNF